MDATTTEGATVPSAEMREQLQKVLSSAVFRDSSRLKRMLEYLFEHSVTRQPVSEHAIAVNVFDRTDEFEPVSDPVVRVHAGRLRTKLARYYETEGATDRFELQLPRRTYAMEILSRGSPPTAQAREAYKSVAILPFVSRPSVPLAEALGESLTEHLIHAMTSTGCLRVVASQATPNAPGNGMDVGQAGRRLAVDLVLHGTVRRKGDRGKIAVHLVRSRDGTVLWSEIYDRIVRDEFEVVEDVSRSVLSSIGKSGLCMDEARPPAGSSHADAVRFYRQARHYQAFRILDELNKAIGLLDQSTRLDPSFVDSFVALGEAHVLLGMYGGAPMKQAATQARLAALTALSIAPGATHARASLGAAAALARWDFRSASADFMLAIRGKPANPVACPWYALTCLAPQGRFSEAVTHIQDALRGDPAAVAANASLAFLHYLAGDLDAAIVSARNAVDLRKRHFLGYWMLGLAYERSGRIKEAITALRASAAFSNDAPPVVACLAHALAARGPVSEALTIRDHLIRTSRQTFVSPLDLAVAALAAADRDAALRFLAQAVAERSAWAHLIPVEPRWTVLHGEARFQKLLASIRQAATFPEQFRSA